MEKLRIALIPAYQPGPLLLELVREAAEKGFRVVVVNDGSREDAGELFQNAEKYAAVLHHRENRGKGRALKTGLAYIREHMTPGYTVVTMDADGQHRVDDALRVCRAAEAHPERLVLGSRKLKEQVPLRSLMGNTITRFVYRMSTGLRLYDTQTGLRAFGDPLLPEFEAIAGERYEYEMNVLLECSRRDIPVEEVEIETVYLDNNASSHFNTLRDSYRIYKEILKFSAASFFSFLLDYGLYILMLLLTAGWSHGVSLTASNVTARAISASVNYTLNRKLVFRSRNPIVQSAFWYIVLAAGILIGNTLTLHWMVADLGFNRYAAKLCTEVLFFALSWLIQRSFIFRRKEYATR